MKQEDYFKYNFATQFANMISSSMEQARTVISVTESKGNKNIKPEDLARIDEMKEELKILAPKLKYYQRIQAEIHDKYFDIAWDYGSKE